VKIRPERDGDAPAIRQILIAAFDGPAEADLVERLRREGDLALALVAKDDSIHGYVAFPRLKIEDGDATRHAVGLAPLAVMPERQRLGIGGALVREGHRLLVERGQSLCFVLGDPAYYTRFGYSVGGAGAFKSAYSGPHFMALRLSPDAPQGGRVIYPAAFDALG
jgi:putative acetyltransferase